MQIQVATAANLEDFLHIQALAYGDSFNEPAEALLAKLMLANESTFVAVVDGEVCAYGMAFPWRIGEPVVLHSIDIAAPKITDCMYIHDVAVGPAHTRKGIAQALVNAIVHRAGELHINSFELVAVQDSAEFWKRNGFVVHGTAGSEYGPGAVKMKR